MKPSVTFRRCFIFTECTSDSAANIKKFKLYDDNPWIKGVILNQGVFDRI